MSEVNEVHHTDSGGGVATGMVVGILLVFVVIALLAVFFFSGAFRPAASTGPAQPSNPINIQVNPPAAPPAKIDVNINPPAQQAPTKP